MGPTAERSEISSPRVDGRIDRLCDLQHLGVAVIGNHDGDRKAAGALPSDPSLDAGPLKARTTAYAARLEEANSSMRNSHMAVLSLSGYGSLVR